MDEGKRRALDKLTDLGLAWTLTEHEAVYTIEEMERLHLPEGGAVCKNLFLRDYKGKNHYLVVLRKDKRADLKALGGPAGQHALELRLAGTAAHPAGGGEGGRYAPGCGQR